jgi:REP element-mobilizing transposase RayT
MRAWETRRSPRLVEYDYSLPGLYFVTICTLGREPTLGDAVSREIQLSRAGEAVLMSWQGLPARFPGLALDAFVIMPTHVHGIVVLGVDPNFPEGNGSPDLNRVMRSFKSISGIAANHALGRTGRPFWQRSYHDRIIRNERDLALARAYIVDNPACWELDSENPAAPAP